LQHLLVQKQQRRLGLVLRRSRHRALDRQMTQKRRHLDRIHVEGMAFFMEQNEAPNPLHIGILGPNAVVPEPNLLTHPVKQTHGLKSPPITLKPSPKSWPPGGFSEVFQSLTMPP
jgi:hypothetical protein